MRLAGIGKGGFYPYPIHMAETTASWFIQPQETHGHFLAPCAGEGEILPALGELLNYEICGCELFSFRAEKVATLIDKCHSASLQIFARIIRSLASIYTEYLEIRG